MRTRTLQWAGLVALAAAPALAAPRVGAKAPSISAVSWLNLPEGMKGLTSADLKGRVLFLEFWATW